jgi:hypothetical protein
MWRHLAAALLAAAARPDALFHVADALATHRARCANLRARSAYVRMHGRIGEHEVCRRPADLGAARHDSEVSRLEVLASGLEAVIHGFTSADFITFHAFPYAVLHLLAECVHCVLLDL